MLFFILLLVPARYTVAEENAGDPLTVGVPVDRCPMFYQDPESHEVVGIGADLMRTAAEEAGYDVTFKIIEEDSLKELAKLEKMGKLSSVITQNIDGFHQEAGSKNVLELHGSIKRNYCMKCKRFFDGDYVFSSKGVPKCPCGGIIKPDVVLYEEGLDEEVMQKTIQEIRKADLFIIAGTSLAVYPAASFIRYYNGKRMVLINRDETPYDAMCDLVIHDSLGKIFKEIEKEIQ